MSLSEREKNEPQFFRAIVKPEAMSKWIRGKWSDSTLGEGFVACPKRLMRLAPRLLHEPDGLELFLVILGIVDCKAPNLPSTPSPEYLAFVLDIPVPTLLDRLHRLQEIGLIRWMFSDDKTRLVLSVEPLERQIARMIHEERIQKKIE